MINKNEIAIQLNNIFKLRRQTAKQVAENNLNTALQNKDVHDSFYAIRSMQIDLSRATDEKTIKEYESKIEAERKKLREALAKTPFKKEDFIPHYLCSKCKDTGYIGNEKCSCFKLEQSKLYLQNSGINTADLPSFDNIKYDIFEKPEETKKLYSLAKEYVEKQNSAKCNFIICGKTGVGKTHLSQCMLNDAINNGTYTIFAPSYKLNETMLNYHLASLNSKKYILEPYLTCDMLIIDDLGSENILTNVTREYLYLILDSRARDNLKTIITTNLTPEQIQEIYDSRVFSRMFNKQIGIIVNMTGDDLRLKIK